MTDSSEYKPEHGERRNADDADSNTGDHPAEPTEADWLEVEAALSSRSKATTDPNKADSGRVTASRRAIDPSHPLMMVETAFLASAASLIWLVNFYFPVGPLLRIFFPIPIALIYLRWNNRSAWMGALISGLLLSVLMGPVRSIQYVMPFGLLGVLLGLFWKRRANWGISVGIGALLGALGLFFRIWLVSVLLGDDLWLYATNQITGLLEWVFIRLGLLIQPSLELVQLALVVMILFNNLVYLFVVHLVALFLLDRLGNPIPRPPRWVQVMLEYEE
jgi:uncharacterized protein YybS (DUF2232 family)